MFSDQSIRFAYFGFNMLLYFEQRVFLALDIVFSYCNKDTHEETKTRLSTEVLSSVSPAQVCYK